MDISSKESPSFTFSNSLPEDTGGEATSTPLTPFELRLMRRTLFSHIASLILGLPSIVLFAIDLNAYLSRSPRRSPSPVQPGQYVNVNPITILDGLGLALLSLEIIYSVAYISARQLMTPDAIRAHVIPIFFADAILCVGIQAISDTTIGMRTNTGVTNCQRFTYLDVAACDSYRRTIACAAGAMGVVTSGMIHVRWSMSMHVWWCRGRRCRKC